MANPRDPMTNQQYYTPGVRAKGLMKPVRYTDSERSPPFSNPTLKISHTSPLSRYSSPIICVPARTEKLPNNLPIPWRHSVPPQNWRAHRPAVLVQVQAIKQPSLGGKEFRELAILAGAVDHICIHCSQLTCCTMPTYDRRKKIRCNLTQMPLGEDDPEDDEDEDEQNGRQYERSSVAYRPQTANGPPLPPRKPRECVNCLQAGLVCTFTKSAAKRGPNTGYIQHLETRLAALESSVNGEDISKQTKLEQRRPMTGGSILSIHDPKKRSRSTSVNAEPAPSLGDAGYGALLGGTPAGPVSERMIPDGTAGSIALQSRNISSPAPALKESQTPLHHHIAKKQRLSGKLPPILTTVYQHSSHVSGQISGHFPGDVPSTSTDTLQLATTVPRQVDTSPSGVTSNRTASPERKYRHYERPVSGSGVSQSSTDVTIRESPATHTYDYHARPSGPVYASRPSPRDPEHRKATLPPISKLLSEIPPEPLLPPRQHAPPDHARYRPLSAHPIPSVAGQPSVSPPGYAVRQPEQHFAYASTGSVDGSSRSEGNHDTRSSANHRMHSLSGSSSLTAAGPSARTSPESTHKTRGYATSDRSIVKRPSRELHQTNPSISTRGKPLDDPRQSHNQASIRYSGEGGRMMVDRDHDSTHLRRELFSTPAMRTFALLPLQRLHSGFSGCRTLIRAGKLLISPGNRIPNDSWLAQQCEIIGSAMLPSNTSTSNSDAVPEQVETLLLCYVDAVRRGKNISGVLGAISGKLTVLQSREVDIKRYNAVLTLLAIWYVFVLSKPKMHLADHSSGIPRVYYPGKCTRLHRQLLILNCSMRL